ncbi:MAG: regulatory protein RecX [Clostridia bacterium]|nr:regulatory protein RecX [Clostridia bacterium]
MIIKEIKKRRKSLYAIEFDQAQDLSFANCELDSTGLPLVDAALVAEKGLSKGDTLTNEGFCELVDQSFYRRAKSRAIWYLSRGDLAEKELYKKLIKVFPEEASARAVAKIKELGYIDDERYALRLAENLLKVKRVGVREALAVMTSKGIDRDVAKYALEDTECDTVAVIKELILKKYKNRLGDKKETQKVVAALARRGYGFSDIRSALAEFDTETEIFED